MDTRAAGPESGFTAAVAREVASTQYDAFPLPIVTRSKLVLLDWVGAVVAGSSEPAGRIAQAVAVEAEARPVSRIFGTQLRTSPRDAALANAVAAHALDFDDSSLWANGHVSAAVVSAAVALSEKLGSTTAQLVQAVVAGMEGQARISLASGPSPYAKGFHGTGTFGTFGAAGACARLLDLDAEGVERAYGHAATQAAGLKITFGTMGKHLNAAKAASDGMLAAQLAAQHFTAPTGAVEGRQGFAWTHSTDFDPSRPAAVMGNRRAIESVLFKRHAACHGTHSTIEGVAALRARHGLEEGDVAQVRLSVSDKMLDICCISDPVSGLEGKFSVRHAASVALAGLTTGPDAFTDSLVQDPRMVALRERVAVHPEADRDLNGPTLVRMTLTTGAQVEAEVDVFEPTGDHELASEWEALVAKFTGLTAPVVGSAAAERVVERIRRLDPDLPVSELLDLSA